jgi:formylglycine-generating enzyme required for sulfatase activity
MNENPSRFNTGGPALPAENIDFPRAVEFCRRLSNLPAERRAGRSYRLPTEAEWEHACRAGTFTAYYWGDEPIVHLLNYRGRYDSNEPEQRHPGRTTPVGSYPPNGFGIHEMHGNVWEWTSDWYDQDWYKNSPQVDPQGPNEADEETRTIRGGCWHAVGICCRSAHRFGEEVDTQDDYTGFRVVMVQTGESAP